MSTNNDDQNDEPVTFTSRMFPRLGLGEMWLTFLRDPVFGQPRRCDTELGTKVLVMGSRQPLLDAAGALIAANADPATSMVMKDAGSDTLARTAALGRATGLVADETPSRDFGSLRHGLRAPSERSHALVYAKHRGQDKRPSGGIPLRDASQKVSCGHHADMCRRDGARLPAVPDELRALARKQQETEL
jgi:hypothetical protein